MAVDLITGIVGDVSWNGESSNGCGFNYMEL